MKISKYIKLIASALARWKKWHDEKEAWGKRADEAEEALEKYMTEKGKDAQ